MNPEQIAELALRAFYASEDARRLLKEAIAVLQEQNVSLLKELKHERREERDGTSNEQETSDG